MQTVKTARSRWTAVLFAFLIVLGGHLEVAAEATLYGLAHQGPDGPSTLYMIDATNGMTSLVGPTGFNRCSGMDLHPSGTMYATCRRNEFRGRHVLVTINLQDGTATEVGPTGVEDLEGFPAPFEQAIFDTASDISFRASDGALYAYLKPSDGVGTINVDDGGVTFLGFINSTEFVGRRGNGISFSGGVLFHGNNVSLNTLDNATGEATHVADHTFPADAGSNPRINAMDVHPDTGELFASLATGSGSAGARFLTKVDRSMGTVTKVGETIGGLDAIAWSRNETAGPLPFKDLWIKKANVRFSRHSSKYDRIEVRGKFILNDESDGIDLYRSDDLELVLGGSSMLIPAGSFVPIGSKLRFSGNIDGMRVWAKIKEIHHQKYEFRITTKGLDLMGFGNPSDVHLRIGDDAGGTNIRLKGTLTFRKHRKDRDRDKDEDDDDDKDKDDD